MSSARNTISYHHLDLITIQYPGASVGSSNFVFFFIFKIGATGIIQ